MEATENQTRSNFYVSQNWDHFKVIFQDYSNIVHGVITLAVSGTNIRQKLLTVAVSGAKPRLLKGIEILKHTI